MDKKETTLVYQAIIQASQGQSGELQKLIAALTNERDQLIQLANARIAALNGQIGLLQTILEQARQNSVPE